MEELYQEYEDIAGFYIVYIQEAHATDSRRPVPYAEDLGIKRHKTIAARCTLADKLVKDKKLTIPCLIDNMDDEASEAYQAHPDRIFLIRTDGRLGVASDRGPWGFAPGLEETSEWLAEFRKTGKMPSLSKGNRESKKQEKEKKRRKKKASAKLKGKAKRAFKKIVGEWAMETKLNSYTIEATMRLSIKDGKARGEWHSRGRRGELMDLVFEDGVLSFSRAIGESQVLEFEGSVDGDEITGTFSGFLGEVESIGRRKEASKGDKKDKQKKKDKRKKKEKQSFRGRLGEDSDKIRRQDGKTFVWASGERNGKRSEWFDFTGAPFPPEKLQFGIGRDRIAAIDDPLFVEPDDPRLLDLPPSPYRRDERPSTNDEIMVIGYVRGDDIRAYPASLLDHHELVNDHVGGKPVTVGW